MYILRQEILWDSCGTDFSVGVFNLNGTLAPSPWNRFFYLVHRELHSISVVPPYTHTAGDFPLEGWRFRYADWRFFEKAGKTILMTDENSAVDLTSMEPVFPVLDDLKAQYLRGMLDYDHKMHNFGVSYFLGEYRIFHKTEKILECWRGEQKLWQFRIHAYLYSDFGLWKDRLFFGTAGQGGEFYELHVETGEVLLKVKTGGTVRYAQDQSSVYFCGYQNIRDTQSAVYCVDLDSASIRETMTIPGRVSDNKVFLRDSLLVTASFFYKKDHLTRGMLHIIHRGSGNAGE